MNQEQPRRGLNQREQVLAKAARRLRDYDEKFGDPAVVSSCAGELQRTFLSYSIRSQRRLTAAEHSAVDEALRHIARIACGPVVHEDSYVEAGAFLAIAGEIAIQDTPEVKPVVPPSKGTETDEDIAGRLEASVAAALENRSEPEA